MNIKPGVDLRGIQPEILLGFCIADVVYNRIAGKGATVTSVKDGEHMVGSLHYNGYAIDLRTNDVPTDVLELLFTELKKALGGISSQYDLVVENDHFHLEFDPDK